MPKFTLTLMIQKEFTVATEDDIEAKTDEVIAALEKDDWAVDLESQDSDDDDDEEFDSDGDK